MSVKYHHVVPPPRPRTSTGNMCIKQWDVYTGSSSIGWCVVIVLYTTILAHKEVVTLHTQYPTTQGKLLMQAIAKAKSK